MDPPPARVTVFRSAVHGRCQERLIVLRIAGLEAALERRGYDFSVVVAEKDFEAARVELERYDAENRPAPVPAPPAPACSNAWLGSAAYLVVIVAFFVLSRDQAVGPDWLAAGAAEAGLIRNGQWWRVVTALCLHGDAEHLLGNMVFGGLLGWFAGRRFGPGLAWLAIVLSGALGNAVNAGVQPAEHGSIGASTAAFGALGILAAHAWRGRADSRSRPVERWAPLVSGVVLLAMFGLGGERTDVVAHLTGFGSGVLAGWILAAVSPASFSGGRAQIAGGLGAGALVASAWVLAAAMS